jgi:hypothetical protein
VRKTAKGCPERAPLHPGGCGVKRRLGRRLNHSRPDGREVLSPAGRGMPGRGRPADKRLKRDMSWELVVGNQVEEGEGVVGCRFLVLWFSVTWNEEQ